MNKNKIWLVVVGLLIGGYLFTSNASNQDNTKRTESGKIEKSGDLGVFQIKVGDCFNDLPSMTPDSTTTIEKVTGVPCSGSHHWEAFADSNSTLATFDLKAVEKEAIDFCSNESAYSFIKTLPTERQNQISELYGDAEGIYTYPLDDYSFKQSKSISCFIGSYTKYYTGSIRE